MEKRKRVSDNRPNYLSNNGIPRRNRVDLATPVEVHLRKALEAVESLGASRNLTMHLLNCLDIVADWVEENGHVVPELTKEEKS